MTKIYSKINPDQLLHMIVRAGDIKEGRENLCPDQQFLQCAALRLPKGTTFKAHRHNWNQHNEQRIAQESWHIVKGKVLFMCYDTDGTFIDDFILSAGDTTFTFEGGHNYEIQEDDTVVMEYKTGKYVNQETDKTFI